MTGYDHETAVQSKLLLILKVLKAVIQHHYHDEIPLNLLTT